ncbi:MAG: glycosyltransferase, partial [Chthoniobacterales bacterium]
MIENAVWTALSWIYVFAALALATYALHAYGILAVLLRHSRRSKCETDALVARGLAALGENERWPDVLTQLPLYNEANVAERVIRATASMEYPGRHRIQVLDDSTDDCRSVVGTCVTALQKSGVDIQLVRRANRHGFKAGALSDGLELDPAEFVAVFDADFVPPPDFLLRSIPALMGDSRIGFVQGRWSFLNECDSLLTRAQAVGLDSHFALEQDARSSNPEFFMNFNGTAGVWRRQAIHEAGGWNAETLTEDLDLSYRVQLAGWRGLYLSGLAVPGELPQTFSAYKSQQFRWAKGSMQVALKMLPAIMRSKDVSLSGKFECAVHLTHYAVHPLLLIVVLLGPWLWIGNHLTVMPGIIGTTLFLASFAPTVFYAAGQRRLHHDWQVRLLRLPALTLAGMGLAIGNTKAVVEAVIGRQSPFVRTPKAGACLKNSYSVSSPVHFGWEITLAIYSMIGAGIALASGSFGAMQFGCLASASFFYVGIGSLLETHQKRANKNRTLRVGIEIP